jgi:hypothetical protein
MMKFELDILNLAVRYPANRPLQHFSVNPALPAWQEVVRCCLHPKPGSAPMSEESYCSAL